MDSILYLHGFHSSPYSAKALEFKKQIELNHPHISVIAPQLAALPQDAIRQVVEIARQYTGQLIGVVGSSMGGYLATYLHNEFNLPAVVVNPAVKPFELLANYKGEQVHPLTNERYVLGDEHMAHLRDVYQPTVRDGKLVWLLQQEGDEVLDFAEAIKHYKDCLITCEKDGSHAFEGFERYPNDIVEFFTKCKTIN